MKKSAAIFALAALGVSAQATTLTFHNMASGLSTGVSISFNGTAMNVSAGPQEVSLNGGTRFNAYCVDLSHWNSAGSSYGVNVNGLSTVANSGKVENLFEKYSLGVNSASTGAAFQLALWDIVYDGGDGLSSGSFKASGLSSNVASLFGTYVGGASTPGGTAMNFSVYNATSHGANGDKYQNLMSAAPVPEPATMVVLATGALALYRKRRNNA